MTNKETHKIIELAGRLDWNFRKGHPESVRITIKEMRRLLTIVSNMELVE